MGKTSGWLSEIQMSQHELVLSRGENTSSVHHQCDAGTAGECCLHESNPTHFQTHDTYSPITYNVPSSVRLRSVKRRDICLRDRRWNLPRESAPGICPGKQCKFSAAHTIEEQPPPQRSPAFPPGTRDILISSTQQHIVHASAETTPAQDSQPPLTMSPATTTTTTTTSADTRSSI